MNDNKNTYENFTIQRKNIKNAIKIYTLEKQNYKCANFPNSNLKGLSNYSCPLWRIEGEDKGKFLAIEYHFDHIIEESKCGITDKENIQALCGCCHVIKTKDFMKNRNTDESYIKFSNTRKINKEELIKIKQQKKEEKKTLRKALQQEKENMQKNKYNENKENKERIKLIQKLQIDAINHKEFLSNIDVSNLKDIYKTYSDDKILRIKYIGIEKFNNFNFNIAEKLLEDDKYFKFYIKFKTLMNENHDFGIFIFSHIFNKHCDKDMFDKIIYYKKIANILKIKNYVKYDYDKDKINFREKIDIASLFSDIPYIYRIFRKKQHSYKDFDKEFGYLNLYKMSITMCNCIFNEDKSKYRLLDSEKRKDKVYNSKFVNVTKYKYKEKFYDELIVLI